MLEYTIHLMSDPEGNIRTRAKTKLTGFPRDLTLIVLLYFQSFTSTATKE